MARKYKATGCAKFALVIIILAPLAYIGASYYNGEDGIQNIKDLLGIGQDTPTEIIKTNEEPETKAKIIRETDETSTILLDSLKAENKRLKDQLEAKENEILKLKHEAQQ